MLKIQRVINWLRFNTSEKYRKNWQDRWFEVVGSCAPTQLTRPVCEALCLELLYILEMNKKWIDSRLFQVVVADHLVSEYSLEPEEIAKIVVAGVGILSIRAKKAEDGFGETKVIDRCFLKKFFVEVVASPTPNEVLDQFGCGEVLLKHLNGSVSGEAFNESLSQVSLIFSEFIQEMSSVVGGQSAWIARNWLQFRLLEQPDHIPQSEDYSGEIATLISIELSRSKKIDQAIGERLEKAGLIYSIGLNRAKGKVLKSWELTNEARWFAGALFFEKMDQKVDAKFFEKLSCSWQKRCLEKLSSAELAVLLDSPNLHLRSEIVQDFYRTVSDKIDPSIANKFMQGKGQKINVSAAEGGHTKEAATPMSDSF